MANEDLLMARTRARLLAMEQLSEKRRKFLLKALELIEAKPLSDIGVLETDRFVKVTVYFQDGDVRDFAA